MISRDLTDQELRALAYFAVGVSSEGSLNGRDVSHKLSFAGKTGERLSPVGNSGYSIGTLQTDLGQHPDVAKSLVFAYQKWAQANHPDWMLNDKQVKDNIHYLSRQGRDIKGGDNKPLDPSFKSHLNDFLSSTDGISFIHARDLQQIHRLTDSKGVFAQIRDTTLYRNASIEDKAQLAAIAFKLENQCGLEGGVPKTIITGMKNDKFDSVEAVRHRLHEIGPKSVNTGVADALSGAQIFNRLQNSDPKSPVSQAWRNVLADNLNPAQFSNQSSKQELASNYAEVKNQFLHHRGVQHQTTQLHRGSHSHAVTELQTQLQALGYLDRIDSDGRRHFGPATHSALEAFQRDHNLKGDGRLGPETRRALDEAFEPHKQARPIPLTSLIHPGHDLFAQMQTKLCEFNARLGVEMAPHHLNQLAASLTVQAYREGFTRIDKVDIGQDRDQIWVLQNSLAVMPVSVKVMTGVNTPIEQSTQQWNEVNQQRQALEPAQHHHHHHQESGLHR
jgi:peptidoglycan hydrolase-like protein with peptidoglycan-binding domain